MTGTTTTVTPKGNRTHPAPKRGCLRRSWRLEAETPNTRGSSRPTAREHTTNPLAATTLGIAPNARPCRTIATGRGT